LPALASLSAALTVRLRDRLPLFAIDEPRLAPELYIAPDQGDRASDHGVIEAARQVSVAAHQAAVASSEPHWRPA
jgi:hypothetical protein